MSRTLLYKLGYTVLPANSKKRVRIYFKDEIDKRRFFTNFSGHFGDWVLAEGDLTAAQKKAYRNYIGKYEGFISENMFDATNFVDFYNPVLLSPPNKIQNLAVIISPDHINNRRKYSALQLPYAFTDIPESINLFSYDIGTIQDEHLILNFIGKDDFATNYEDARWMARKIGRLSEEDLFDLVETTDFPDCIGTQLFEVLKARRNDLLVKLNLKSEFSLFPVTTKLNCGSEVKKGVVVKSKYDGFGNRFSHDRFEGPLVLTEIWNIIQSIGFSNVISNAMFELNKKIPKTDIAEEVYKHKLDLSAKQFAEFIQTGKTSKVDFGSYKISFFNFGLNYSKDLIAGPYLGTNNAVQMVENVGFNMGLGNYYGFDGTHPRDFLSAVASLSYQVALTHIRPIQIEQPKIEGVESNAKGAFEKAVEEQSSNLLGIFSLPLESFSRWDSYEELDFDGYALSPELVKSLIDSIEEFDPSLSSPLKNILSSAVNAKNLEEVKALQKTAMQSFMKLSKSFNEIQDLWQENLKALKNESAKEKWNLVKTRTLFLKNLSDVYFEAASLKEQNIDDVVTAFMDAFQVGDSVLVHHNYDASGTVNGAHAFTGNSAWFLDLKSGYRYIFRTHMNRIDKNNIQVYRSLADKSVFGFVTGLRVYLRLLYTGYDISFGEVISKKYNISLKPESSGELPVGLPTTPKKSYLYTKNIFGKMAALRKLMFTGDLSELKKFDQATEVNHKYLEKMNRWGLFWWRGDNQELFHRFSIKDPDVDGQSVEVLRYLYGERVGAAYQDFALDYTNVYIREHSSKEINLNVSGNSDPGRSFFGYSKYREGSFEAIIPKEGGPLEDQCMSIRFRWNEFIVSPEELEEELRRYREKFGIELAGVNQFARTKRMEIFSFQTTVNLYSDALKYVSALQWDTVKAVVDDYLIVPERSGFKMHCKNSVYIHHRNPEQAITQCHIKSLYKAFEHRFKEMKAAIEEGSYQNKMKRMTDFILFSEKYLRADGFHQLIGGKDRFFMMSKVDAYRKGDEITDASVFFDSYGRLPGIYNYCPVAALSNAYGYQQSELLLQWLNSRL